MARTMRTLTNTKILHSKPIEKYLTLHDGDGLFMAVKTTGKKLWRFRYQRPVTKKRTMMGRGAFPVLSIADARRLRAEYLSLQANGIDPQTQAKHAKEQQQLALDNIFSTIAANWFKLKSKSVIPDYAKDIWTYLEKVIFISICEMLVQQIRARTLVEVLEPIKACAALETVLPLVQRINEIMICAVNTGSIDAKPASGEGMAFEKPKKKHMPILRPEELPRLMRTLVVPNLSIMKRCLIEWQFLTVVRPSEAADARWDEIVFATQLWKIPAQRMKAKREHIVSLFAQTLVLLQLLKSINFHRDLIFLSKNNSNRHINCHTANAALKRLGYRSKLVAYGLRSIASTAQMKQVSTPILLKRHLLILIKMRLEKLIIFQHTFLKIKILCYSEKCLFLKSLININSHCQYFYGRLFKITECIYSLNNISNVSLYNYIR